MEVSPAKSLILSATIHGGSYFFIQPENVVDQTLYEYDTYMATYIRDAKSVIYNEVNAYIEEEV